MRMDKLMLEKGVIDLLVGRWLNLTQSSTTKIPIQATVHINEFVSCEEFPVNKRSAQKGRLNSNSEGESGVVTCEWRKLNIYVGVRVYESRAGFEQTYDYNNEPSSDSVRPVILLIYLRMTSSRIGRPSPDRRGAKP